MGSQMWSQSPFSAKKTEFETYATLTKADGKYVTEERTSVNRTALHSGGCGRVAHQVAVVSLKQHGMAKMPKNNVQKMTSKVLTVNKVQRMQS